MLFLDTSALVKAYVEEDGSRAVHGAMKRMDGFLFISDIVAVEVLNTLRSKYNRGSLPEKKYRVARDAFLRAYPNEFQVRPIAPDVVVRAMGVAITHNRKGVGGVDVLHLATASHIQAKLPAGIRLSFATADIELKQLAAEHGLPTFDPLHDPLSTLPRRPTS